MLSHIETGLFFFINKTIANPVLDFLMPRVTNLGVGDVAFAAALLIIVFGRKEQKRFGVLLLAGLALTHYSTHFLKDFIGRPRPYVACADVRLLVPGEGTFSMPSGHSVTAFMTATILAGLFKRRAIWFTLAGLVGFSRVYVGVHYVSDVLAGALLGALIGYGLLKFAEYTHLS